MEKTGYKEAYRGTASAGVNIDKNGNIIGSSGETAAGTKTLTFNMVNADNNLAENQAFVDIFINQILSSTYQPGTQKLRVNWEV